MIKSSLPSLAVAAVVVLSLAACGERPPVAIGPPELVAKTKGSYTGDYLRRVLGPTRGNRRA